MRSVRPKSRDPRLRSQEKASPTSGMLVILVVTVTMAGALLAGCFEEAAAQSGAEPVARPSAAQSRGDPLVTGFDLERCCASRLVGFDLVRIHPVWGTGLEARVLEPSTGERIDLTVGVLGSSPEAAEAAAALVGDYSVRFEMGSLSGQPLGEGSWSRSGEPPPARPESAVPGVVVFHRDNVLVRILGSSRQRAQALAETVDDDLAGNADYVARGAEVIRPTIESVLAPEGSVAIGGEMEIRLAASTATGRGLLYMWDLEGGALVGGDPPAALQYRPHAIGRHLLRFAAVDERCVVSASLEIPVEVVEGK